MIMHEGHRARLVGKIIGGGKVYEHELLEALLFNACPRRDLNATAHVLIDRFGSIDGVLSAGVEELSAVDGVGANMAEYIACLGGALAISSGCTSFAVLNNRQQFKEFITNRAKVQTDVLEICVVDNNGRVKRICNFTAEKGCRVSVSQSEMLRTVSVCRPYGVFVAYRRSFGGSLPENGDDEIAKSLHGIARLCGAYFYDFCIVDTDGEVYSYYVKDRLMFGGRVNGESYGE